MDTPSVFVTVSLVMLANGLALGVTTSSLPRSLRPAAIYWQIATLMIALGCLVFAYGTLLPAPVMVTAANSLLVLGLYGYYCSLRLFHGRTVPPLLVLLPVAAMLWVLVFSAVYPDFKIRVVGMAVVWLALMGGSLYELTRRSQEATSVSRRMLTGIFAFAIACVVIRAIGYQISNVDANYALVTNDNWLNPLSPLLLPLLPIIGTTAFILMCTERLRRQLQVAASTDYLTELPNRRTLAESGKAHYDRARRLGRGFAVAVLDVDGFKSINDAHGHDVGDQALVHVAARLRGAVRELDVVARTGGEEFVALLDDLATNEAFAAVERIRAAVEDGHFDESRRIRITISAGVAVFRAEDDTFETVLRRADDALYVAKAEGRNRVKLAA
ncbi:GGDEF domain-containing protein [Paradevosia shaoguanensis]|uniref:diguanylate cyclase n=1 Tax=Paradevosia shaoguanensis TaxID=1335043 RepID=A0AA41QLG7_9HYPH|nr:GGDEF domain-containing protein [Paradevosia shaoguanensis]MCF1742568.1 GGDEF domain-containing protein [Paradevosia shaoguanensis]MCI0127051.1 GGDEF domain-containing protein [Paradevosia shaoguanensis]